MPVSTFASASVRYLPADPALDRERWIARLIEDVRQGRLVLDQTLALAQLAASRSELGAVLPARVAAVELINLLRPTVAIAWYVTFAAHALLRQPHCLQRLRDDANAFEPDQ